MILQSQVNCSLYREWRRVCAIFVWHWNENARTKQKQQTNGNRAIWLVYNLDPELFCACRGERLRAHSQTRKHWGREWLVCRTDTNARSFKLVKRTVGWKNFMPKGLSRNQSILRFDVILQHDWPIEKCLLHIRVFFGRKTKSPCFDLFIHRLIKQIRNIRKSLCWHEPDSLTRPQSSLFGTHGENSSLPLRRTEPWGGGWFRRS